MTHSEVSIRLTIRLGAKSQDQLELITKYLGVDSNSAIRAAIFTLSEKVVAAEVERLQLRRLTG